jgi:glycosyltransferase involved in cell wall biosynthesis
MKIAFITTYFQPFHGGVESNVFYLAKELSKNNEVHIFTSDRKDGKIIEQKEEKVGNLFVHRCKTIFRFKYYLVFYPELLNQLLKYDFDIIHVNSLGFIWHDICVLIKKLQSKKTKFIITPHGPFMTLKEYPLYQKIAKKIVTVFFKLSGKVYDKIIEVNPYQEEWLTNEYGFKKDKIIYIPNGIDNSLFEKESKRLKEYLVKRYNLKNKLVITFIGRLSKYKGVQDILEVLPKNKNIKFIVIGQDAGYYNELKNIVTKNKLEDQIIFLQECSDKEKNGILELSEIFVLPSEWEAFGITILEAMAKGNAIITTKTEGGRFLVSEENGILYDFNNKEQLKMALNELISNKKLRNKIQKNNINKAKGFIWDKIAKQLEEVYKK